MAESNKTSQKQPHSHAFGAGRMCWNANGGFASGVIEADKQLPLPQIMAIQDFETRRVQSQFPRSFFPCRHNSRTQWRGSNLSTLLRMACVVVVKPGYWKR